MNLGLNLSLKIGIAPLSAGSSGSYSPEATALFARMIVQPDATRKSLINTLINSLKSAGVWTKFDGLYLAGHTSQATSLNWVSSSYNLSAVNSPTFTTDRGYTGDGGAAYLDTGFNPASSTFKMTQNSAHIAVYSRTVAASTTDREAGQLLATTTSLAVFFATASSLRGAINGSALSNYGSSLTTGVGHALLNRVNSTNQDGYKNGALLQSNAVSSAAMTSANLVFLRNSAQYSVRQLSAMHMGGGLTSTEISNLYSAVNTYLTAIGAN